jgi:hypothetical protein
MRALFQILQNKNRAPEIKMSNERIEKKFNHTIGGEEVKCTAKEEPSSYGQSVTVTFADKEGNARNTIVFRCMPGFKGFDYYNNMSISDLIDIVIQRIHTGEYDSDLEECKNKLTLTLLINDAEYREAKKTRKDKGNA